MEETTQAALITNDAVVLGILISILALIFYLSSHSNAYLQKFFTYVPSLLLCYFIPGILNSLGIISGENSSLYGMAKNYLLPASLVLFTLSIDFKSLLKLGPKALIVFLAGTIGVVIGGPIALFLTKLMFPNAFAGTGADEVWRGMTTIAGSWIGGGANQTAMKEVFQPSGPLFSVMIAVDVFVANIWMAVLLYGAARSKKVDSMLKADSSLIDDIKKRMREFREQSLRIPKTKDLMIIAGVAFGAVAIAHFASEIIAPYLAKNYPQLESFSFQFSFKEKQRIVPLPHFTIILPVSLYLPV